MGHLKGHGHDVSARPSAARGFHPMDGASHAPLHVRVDVTTAPAGTIRRSVHRNMFYKASAFNADISTWDTSSVTTMQ